MATFPSAVKSFTNPSAANTMDQAGLELDVVISAIQDEINAIETELGAATKTITDATAAGASPTSVAQYLDMVATQLKAIIGGANWYTAVSADLADIASVSSSLTSHLADTSVHGVSGDVLGTTDTQTVTNKDLSGSSNTYREASTTETGAAEIATAAETSAGTDTARVISPDGFAGSDYGKRIVQVALNGSTALTTSDKAYFRIPSVMNGWNLVSVAVMCKTASSSGTPTFTIKNGATSMLSTNLTIDENETDSGTAATAAVIDTGEDDVATGNQIEIACTTAGTGTAYTVVELIFQLP